MKNVTIIGSGNSGLGLAADLKSRGYYVCLYSHPGHNEKLKGIINQNFLFSDGLIKGKWQIDFLTEDLIEAVSYSDYILLALPSYAHDTFFPLLKNLGSKKVFINLNGNLSSYILHNLTKGASYIIETNSSPLISRADSKGNVQILGIKQFIPAASLGKKINLSIKKIIAELLHCKIEWHETVISVSLQSYNGVLHPAPTLLNTGWTESPDKNFFFYKEGISPSVCKVIEAVDEERLKIAQLYHLHGLRSTLHALQEMYDVKSRNIYEFCQKFSSYTLVKASKDIRNRYLTEDVPYVLVPWYALGKKVGYHAKTIKTLIDLASLIHGENYEESGRNLKKLAAFI